MAGPTKTAGSFSRHAIVRADAPVTIHRYRTGAAELREAYQRHNREEHHRRVGDDDPSEKDRRRRNRDQERGRSRHRTPAVQD